MGNDDTGSVTRWLGDLKAGDATAAQPLWDRYFERLVRLARARLRSSRHPSGAEDEEDAVLSAFDSFCRGVAAGRFPQLSDREDLWRLLMTLTVRKALNQLNRQQAAKRGGNRVVLESDLCGEAEDGPQRSLEHLASDAPTPEFAAMIAEQCRLMLAALGDDTLRQVAIRKLEGYTNAQIADRLGCAQRTVVNKLKVIRLRWERAVP